MRVDTGEVTFSLLPPPCTHLTEQALDLLNEFKQDGFSQKDVDPRVQDGVEGSKPDRSQVGVFLQTCFFWGLVQLVQKHLSLQKKKCQVLGSA